MTNCTHHSGAKRVPEAVLIKRPVNLSKMVMGMFGCVLIFRRQQPKNKTQLKGEIGLFGGVVKSVLDQEQIICLTVPELYRHTSREHYLAPKSATVIFPFNNDPPTDTDAVGWGVPGLLHEPPGRRWNDEGIRVGGGGLIRGSQPPLGTLPRRKVLTAQTSFCKLCGQAGEPTGIASWRSCVQSHFPK
jgi:hypothetical protein